MVPARVSLQGLVKPVWLPRVLFTHCIKYCQGSLKASQQSLSHRRGLQQKRPLMATRPPGEEGRQPGRTASTRESWAAKSPGTRLSADERRRPGAPGLPSDSRALHSPWEGG